MDSAARITADALSKQTGVPVIVENVPGAGTTIGAARVAQAAPDGYTIFWGSSSLAIVPHIMKNLRFDPVQSFKPVGMVADSPFVLVANPNKGYSDIREFIFKAKERGDKTNFSSPGIGSSPHLVGELFNAETGIKATHIPYASGAQAVTSVVGGDVDFTFDPPTTVVPLVKGGKLRALAVTSNERWKDLPDVPTLNEAGFSQIDVTAWMGLLAPAETKDDVVTYLNQQLQAALQEPRVIETLAKAGLMARPSTPEQFGARIAGDSKRWGDLVKATGISVQ